MQSCALGRYSPLGAAECTDAPKGYFVPSPDLLPQLCELGKYSLKGSANCTICPAVSQVCVFMIQLHEGWSVL